MVDQWILFGRTAVGAAASRSRSPPPPGRRNVNRLGMLTPSWSPIFHAETQHEASTGEVKPACSLLKVNSSIQELEHYSSSFME